MLPDSFGLVRDHRNVVVLRTFSKAYGLAGPAHRLRRRRSGRHHRARQGLRAVHRDQRLAGRRHRLASTPPTNCWPAPTPSSPSAPASPRRCATPASPCRRHRPTSSGCRWPSAPTSSSTAPPTTGFWCGPTVRTACASPSPRRTRTTPSSSSPPRWIEDRQMSHDRAKDVRRVDRTHRPDSRRRTRRVLGHPAARHHRLHDRRVEGRRVRHRPPRQRIHEAAQLVRQDVPLRLRRQAAGVPGRRRATSSPTPRP